MSPLYEAGDCAGTSGARRVWTFGYDGKTGYLKTVTDPFKRVTQMSHDKVGRVLKQVLADGRELGMRYDLKGNLTGLRPPGRVMHEFSHTPVDLEESHQPPELEGLSQVQTQYRYNLDKQLTGVTRADDREIEWLYDEEKGRMKGLRTPRGERSYD